MPSRVTAQEMQTFLLLLFYLFSAREGHCLMSSRNSWILTPHRMLVGPYPEIRVSGSPGLQPPGPAVSLWSPGCGAHGGGRRVKVAAPSLEFGSQCSLVWAVVWSQREVGPLSILPQQVGAGAPGGSASAQTRPRKPRAGMERILGDVSPQPQSLLRFTHVT